MASRTRRLITTMPPSSKPVAEIGKTTAQLIYQEALPEDVAVIRALEASYTETN